VSVSVELRGLQELDEKLLLLGKVGGQKAIRQALFHASKPIVARAKLNIRSWHGGSGALHESIGRTFRAGKAGYPLRADSRGVLGGASVQAEGGRFVMQIGPRRKTRVAVALHNLYYRRQRPSIFYGHLLEFGHRVGNKLTGRVSRGAYVPVVTYTTARGTVVTRAGRGAPAQQRPGHVAKARVQPQRFLGPALEATSLQATFIFQNQLRRRVERALRKMNPEADDA
jgi:hypothetical protein